MTKPKTADEAAAELVTAIDEHRRKPLPLGLHFDLPFPQYLADAGLGSGDLKLLAKNPFKWWWKSPMNPIPAEPEKDTPARKMGRAMHKIVLEGREAFDAHYLRGPDQSGLKPGKKGASTRKHNDQAAEGGKEGLKASEYDRLLIASSMIMLNPELASAFTGGQPEVSFFWMDGDVRLKMRVDYLKCIKRTGRYIAAIGDLKKNDDWEDMEFVQSCHLAVRKYQYAAQAAHYLNGAAHMPAAVVEGLVHCRGDRYPNVTIDRLAKCKSAAWQWIFHRTLGAPETASITLSGASKMLAEGQDIVANGIGNYRTKLKEHGTNMWAQHHPVQEFEMERLPEWYRR